MKFILLEKDLIYSQAISRSLTYAGFQSCGMPNSLAELQDLLKVQATFPDIIILDLVSQHSSSFDVVNWLKRLKNSKTVILGDFCNSYLCQNFRERGASAFLFKKKVSTDLYKLPEILVRIHRGMRIFENPPSDKSFFSAAELEVIEKTMVACNNERIASLRAVSLRAVQKIKTNIFRKTGTKNIVEFFPFAFNAGFQFLKAPQKI